MNKFKVLTSVGSRKPTKVTTKRVEIDAVPGLVVPPMMRLDIVAMMTPVHMESDAVIILACNGSAIDVQRNLLVNAMFKGRACPKTAVLAVSGGKEVGINVETSSKWKFVVGHRIVLIGSDPDGREWAA